MIEISRASLRFALGVASLALLAGCAAPERFILLPQSDGRPSALIISGPAGKTTLDEPYAEARVGSRETSSGKTDAASVALRYGKLLGALPARPQTITLYFESGSSKLTAESAVRLPAIQASFARLPAAEIVVTGHTDRVGLIEANDALSLKRAQLIADRLIAAGISRQGISTAGRGEREPLVKTADEVAEPANRRVEVRIR
jgi:outer membrane protein OmpA-like peptidoglycan-associated protein